VQRHRCCDDRHRQQRKARGQRVEPARSTEADRQAEDASRVIIKNPAEIAASASG
jgi:hypothetical protein